MRRIRSRDTSPELMVRRLVSELGFRYRLHNKNLPGKPDLVFLNRRKAILIHGCFWHQHTQCADGRVPNSNQSYWIPKLARNKSRDIQCKRRMTLLGWRYLVIWECDIVGKERRLAKKIKRFLDSK